MAYKCKADCTPEEWARYLAGRRPRHAARYAKQMATPEGQEQKRAESRASYARTQADPERRARYLARQKLKDQRRRMLARLFRPGKAAAVASADPLAAIRAKAFTIPAFDQIIKAMPEKWSMDFKEEIATEAMILLLDRTASTVSEAVKLGLKAHNRLYDRFKTVSIDAEQADGFRIIDNIASDHMENFL